MLYIDGELFFIGTQYAQKSLELMQEGYSLLADMNLDNYTKLQECKTSLELAPIQTILNKIEEIKTRLFRYDYDFKKDYTNLAASYNSVEKIELCIDVKNRYYDSYNFESDNSELGLYLFRAFLDGTITPEEYQTLCSLGVIDEFKVEVFATPLTAEQYDVMIIVSSGENSFDIHMDGESFDQLLGDETIHTVSAKSILENGNNVTDEFFEKFETILSYPADKKPTSEEIIQLKKDYDNLPLAAKNFIPNEVVECINMLYYT